MSLIGLPSQKNALFDFGNVYTKPSLDLGNVHTNPATGRAFPGTPADMPAWDSCSCIFRRSWYVNKVNWSVVSIDTLKAVTCHSISGQIAVIAKLNVRPYIVYNQYWLNHWTINSTFEFYVHTRSFSHSSLWHLLHITHNTKYIFPGARNRLAEKQNIFGSRTAC